MAQPKLTGKLATDIAFELQREGWHASDESVRAVHTGTWLPRLERPCTCEPNKCGTAMRAAIEGKLLDAGLR